jgi:hypothetical protein
MKRLLTVLLALGFVVSACGSGAGDTSLTDTSTALSYDLSCGDFVSIHADFDESFDGYATQKEALESWILGSPGGPPRGSWAHYDGSRWLLVDENGSTVGRTEIVMMNAERYASNEIDYCED